MSSSSGVVHILRNHFPELTDGISRPEVATVGCGRRPQHLWSHMNPYSRPEAATVSCVRRAQYSISHSWLCNIWMFPKRSVKPLTWIWILILSNEMIKGKSKDSIKCVLFLCKYFQLIFAINLLFNMKFMNVYPQIFASKSFLTFYHK